MRAIGAPYAGLRRSSCEQQRQATSPRNAFHPFEQCAPGGGIEAVMPEDDAAISRHRFERAPERVPLALVGHQPDAWQ